MIGAITGDIVGSIYEWRNIKHKNFELFGPDNFFTDDSVLTIALMDAIFRNENYGDVLKLYYTQYPNAGYGGSFHKWASSEECEPYNSWGNGSAMRTSAVGYAYNTLEEVLDKAKHFASFTHNHPEGIKGAQATSAAIFMARSGSSKEKIRQYIATQFDYDLNRTLESIRPTYIFDVSCQGTVPEAIIAFLESVDFEDAIRNAISLGGDSDTLACITGGIAEAFYDGVPASIANQSIGYLNDDLSVVVSNFYNKYCSKKVVQSTQKPKKLQKQMNIVLTDIDGDLIKAWNDIAGNNPHVTTYQGSIFDVGCDAIVSPANSFGFMDGSLDFLISEFFGWHVQDRLQQAIKTKHNGELLVGQVEIVPTDHQSIPYVISAPTMRVPMDIKGTANPYLAIRGVLLAVKNGVFKDGTAVKDRIKTIAFPGMGTGVGQITPTVFAKQMKQAVEDVIEGGFEFPKTIWNIEKSHQNMN